MIGQEPGRKLRADAARNRKQLLDTAAVALAEKGLDVPIAYIARQAGLGKGTVFRRFPTKEGLILAVVLDRLGALIAYGEELGDEPDPEAALHRFLSAGVQLVAENRGVCEAAFGSLGAGSGLPAVYNRIVEIMRDLVTSAQAAGVVRKDVTAEDLVLIQRGIAQMAAPLRQSDPRLWMRYFDLLWDSLRPEAARPLYGEAPVFPWGPTPELAAGVPADVD